MQKVSNFDAALEVLSAVSALKGNIAKAKFLKEHESEELKYLLYVANCQFVVTHLSNIHLDALDPLSAIDQLGISTDGKDVFKYFKDVIVADLTSCKSATNEIRSRVSSFICQFCPDYQQVIIDVLTKRLNIGVSTKSINKIWPNLIPNPSVMLASDDFSNAVQSWPIEDVILNEKFDGVRVIADSDRDLNIRFFTRNFNEIDAKFLPNISNQLKEAAKRYLANCADSSSKFFFDGELTPSDASILREISRSEAKDEAGISGIVGNLSTESRKKISGNLTRMLRGTYDGDDSDFVFNCFDFVEYSGDILAPTLSDKILKERISTLEKLVSTNQVFKQVKFVQSYSIASHEEIVSIYDALIAQEKEGVIAKLATAPYEMRRSKTWQKLKAVKTMDLRISAVELGTPGSRNENRLGNFVCSSDDGKLEVNVGSGFSDQQREEFWRGRAELIGKIVEVEYNTTINDKTGMASLFLPRFKCIRYDKTLTDAA
jgi:DNA ligase-1